MRLDAAVYAVAAAVPHRGQTGPKNRHGEDAEKAGSSRKPAWSPPAATPQGQHGFVNPPVYHASTVLYPTAEDQVAHRARYQYGRRGTPTSEALENALTELEGEGCAGVALLPSGLAAISTALLSVAGTRRPHPGHRQRLPADAQFLRQHVQAHRRRDHLLRSADRRRHRQAVQAEHHARCSSRRPARKVSRCRTFRPSPRVAHDKGAVVLMDNTWATPLYFRAFEKGVDLSIQAGTKYIGGHSDIMFGCVSANARTLPALKTRVQHDGPLRRARRHVSRAARLAHHGACGWRATTNPACASRAGSSSGRKLRACCIRRSKAIPVTRSGSGTSPAPADCSASCSSRRARKPCYAFMNELTLFGMGFSWGGFESLVILFDCSRVPHRDQMGAGRPDAALSHRAGRHRRSDRRSRSAALRRWRARQIDLAPAARPARRCA